MEEKKIEKVYICGKISGIEKIAFRVFQDAEENLILRRYEVVNPMKLPHNHDKSWESYMKECVKALVDCDYIFPLKNSIHSRGALCELDLAFKLKIPILY
jgi:hypothetical protein